VSSYLLSGSTWVSWFLVIVWLFVYSTFETHSFFAIKSLPTLFCVVALGTEHFFAVATFIPTQYLFAFQRQ
jgi:hypothetical protein